MGGQVVSQVVLGDVFVIALMLVQALLQCFLGGLLIGGAQKLLARYFGVVEPAQCDAAMFDEAFWSIPLMWLLGLGLHLCGVFLLKCLGAPWWLAIYLPFTLLVLDRSLMFAVLECLSDSLKGVLNFWFLLWLVFHCVLGYSLFFASNDIKTPWVNNYGDLTFHLGMINHFTFVGDFPPQYHLYVGEKLSYPFFINFWAAFAWVPSGSWSALPWVFLVQWLLLWSVLFSFLNGRKVVVLPWVLLFGGGSFVAIWQQPDQFSWSQINTGFPFTTWLSTIWVTQRSAMLGAAMSLAAVCLILNSRRSLAHVLAGCFLAMMPLAHTHFFIFTALFIGGYLGSRALWATLQQRQQLDSLRAVVGLVEWQRLWCVVVPSMMALVFFPLLLGKSGMVSLMPGWNVPVIHELGRGVWASLAMWFKNAWQWGVVYIALCVYLRNKMALAVIFGLFLLANVVKLAVWEWDQLKAFLAIMAILLCVWAWVDPIDKLKAAWVRNCLAVFGVVLLAFVGVYECARIYKQSPNYQVYSPDKLAMALFIREHSDESDVIATATGHNSAATLSGRSMFMGYPGTLASHKIDYALRERTLKNLTLIERCGQDGRIEPRFCPTIIVWDREGKSLWKSQRIPASFKRIVDNKNPNLVLFKRTSPSA